jgi:membrane protease YdiL (CAAX protease family)
MSNPTAPSDDADSGASAGNGVTVGDDVKIGGPPSDESPSSRDRLRTLGIATGLGFGAIIISVALLLPIFVLGPRVGLPLPDSPLARISLELFIGQVVAMGGLSVLYLRKTGRGLRYVSIRRPTLVESLIVIAAPFGIIFVTAIVTQLSLLAGVEPSQHAIGGLTGIEPSFYLYLVPLMILVVGPFEELLYRGVVQSRLRESFGPVGAIALASLIFAAIHIPAHGFGDAGVASTAASLTALFVGSLVFGGIYEWTENLTVVALIHGLYNGILLTLLYIVTVYGPELEAMAADAETALVLGGL